MRGPTADFVRSTISNDRIVIFSKTSCSYCRTAKEAFDNLKQKYTCVELDQREDTSDVQDVLGEITGARTVHRVIVNGKFIGVGTDVQALYKNGELGTAVGTSVDKIVDFTLAVKL